MRRCYKCGRCAGKKAAVGRRTQKLEEEKAELTKSRQKARSDFRSAKDRLERLRSVQGSLVSRIQYLCDRVNSTVHTLRQHPEGPDLSHDLNLAMVKACAEAAIPVPPEPMPGPAPLPTPAPAAPGQE